MPPPTVKIGLRKDGRQTWHRFDIYWNTPTEFPDLLHCNLIATRKRTLFAKRHVCVLL